MSTLRQLLETAPAVYAELGDYLVPGGAGGGERVSGGSVEAPLPARVDIAEHRHQLVRGLRWWVAQSDELLRFRPHTLGERPRPLDSPAQLAAWLLTAAHLLPGRARRELADNLDAWLRRARKLRTEDGRARLVPLPAECLSTNELYTCGGTLHVAVPVKAGQFTPYLTCRECRGRWGVHEIPDAADRLVPVHVAASVLGVNVSTIKRRAARVGGMVRLGDAIREADAAQPVRTVTPELAQ